jgi:hypothetical protein
MERTRRQPTVSAAKASKLSALEALKAAREGGVKRASTFEVKDESTLYDVVSEQEYAQIAAKRRADGGDYFQNQTTQPACPRSLTPPSSA